MNVGFREAMRDEDWDCLFFHDVDLIPEDDRNTYVCDTHPKHAAIAMDKFGYKSVFFTLSSCISFDFMSAFHTCTQIMQIYMTDYQINLQSM